MSTKSVQLTNDEIKEAILRHSYSFEQDKPETWAEKIERMKYLNKRLNDNKGEAPAEATDNDVEKKKEW